ncbi:CRISPR-associated endoribonuclease Cas6 [Marinicrinis sediminis]|uniref:CRISPR-associated endoribonuclease n=1 Tax=Marinicrinis sediminis TaxID=1652465 RepID=A0ABW5R8R6_9BACL
MVTMKSESPLKLPLAYQQILQGFCYHVLQDRAFAQFLHDLGYPVGKRNFKLFTFSRLTGQYRIDKKHKQIVFEDSFSWQISSIVPAFIQEFGRSLLTADSLHFHGQEVFVDEVRYEDIGESTSPARIRMISPVTVHSTFESASGKKTTQFYDPDDPAFSHLIHENLRKKYLAFYQREMEGDFGIESVNVHPRDKVVTRFKQFMITAWNGVYQLNGTPENIRFAQCVGIGSRNSQGFGMFETL